VQAGRLGVEDDGVRVGEDGAGPLLKAGDLLAARFPSLSPQRRNPLAGFLAFFTDGTTTIDDSPANSITLDRNAGTAPSEDVGPGSVNTLTGEFTLSSTDVSGFGLSASRTASSRRPTAGADSEGQVAIFGPQWTSGNTAELSDSDWAFVSKTSSTSVALVDVDGDETGFTATSSGGWKPEPGSEDLTLTSKDSTGNTTNDLTKVSAFTLKDDDGTTTTTFAKLDPAATTWQVSSTYLPTDNSTTKVVSEKAPSGSSTLARPKYVIAPHLGGQRRPVPDLDRCGHGRGP
jgi:hypothetical protein